MIFPRIILMILMMAVSLAALAGQTFTMGVVPQYDSRRIEEIWSPIIRDVAERAGIDIKLVGAPSIPEFERQFAAGKFDIAYMNPYHVIMSSKSQGYIPILRDVARNLYGVIVVRHDSKIQKVEDLQGKVVAFPAPNSMGASLMPRAEFANKYRINIQPKYVNSHDSVYLNVALGQADAGGGVQKTLERQSERVRKLLRVLHKTEQVPSHPIVIHPRVPQEILDAIKAAFLEYSSSEAGRILLHRVPINRLGEAGLADYESLLKMGLEDFFVGE